MDPNPNELIVSRGYAIIKHRSIARWPTWFQLPHSLTGLPGRVRKSQFCKQGNPPSPFPVLVGTSHCRRFEQRLRQLAQKTAGLWNPSVYCFQTKWRCGPHL